MIKDQQGLHSQQQHQEWLARAQVIIYSCSNMRDSLNRMFSRYYTLPYAGSLMGARPSSLFRFLWNLCFAARHALLPGAAPSQHFPLPLACLNILLASTPLTSTRILRKPFSDHAHFPYRTQTGAADTLQCLVAYSCSSITPRSHQQQLVPQIYSAAIKLTQAVDAFLAEILAPIGILPIGVEELYGSQETPSQQQQPSSSPMFSCPATAVPHSGCRLYVGLIDSNGQVSQSAMHALNTYIDQIVCPAVQIDERTFLEGYEKEREQAEEDVWAPLHENAVLNNQFVHDQQQQTSFVAGLRAVFQGHAIHTPPHPNKTREPVNTATAPTAPTAPAPAGFTFSSPTRATKLSPGKWNISSAGTRLVSSAPTTIQNQVGQQQQQQQQQQQEDDEGDEEGGARKRRKYHTRKKTVASTYIQTPPASNQGTYRPVDALLAAAADAEEELKRSTPSTSDGGGGGSGD